MSTATKNKSQKGVRYTDAQKKEVVDYAMKYNAANGRGGQSKAAANFKISQITVSAWMKAAGAPAPVKKVAASKAAKAPKAGKKAKAPKAGKAPKAAKAPKPGKSKPGTRYTDEQKKEVTEFAVAYSAANGGRGGPSKASKKFGVSPLTVTAWLKAAGVKSSKKTARKGKDVASGKPGKAAKSSTPAVSGGLSAKLNSLLALSNQIAETEAELAKLVAKFESLKASL